MSDSDSFINEVTDEVRSEKLYGQLRRYGWIGVVVVLAIVGGAAWSEYSSAQARNAAQATGDALLSALDQDDPTARALAIAQIEAEGSAAAVTALLTASTQEEAGDATSAVETLAALIANPDAPEMYRDLASFKMAMLPSDDVPARTAALEALSQPGQPFRLLALEQLAYAKLSADDTEGTLEILLQIDEDAAVTQGLRNRVQTLMLALGAPVPDTQTQ